MPDRTAVKQALPPMLYRYDGSFEGLLCCVYESYVSRQPVTGIVPVWEGQSTLYPAREIETDGAHAARVYASLEKKLGMEGKRLVTTAFLSGEEEKAYSLYQFIALGYRVGPSVAYMLGDALVSRIHRMSRSVTNEAHQLLGFVRFSQCEPEELPMLSSGLQGASQPAIRPAHSSYRPAGVLAAVIEPKHQVLPLMSHHFCSRYPEERFLIFDKTNRQALVYHPYQVSLMPLESLELPATEEGEALCRRLWKGYYDAVAIQSRLNPSCRMTHMPKRFWGNLTELAEEAP